ncbi:MAG: PEGA domain-containing protein [Sedimentisphaerales bacterium]|nr:PEGA domain-containing protein [Sedimentisphaerales bacterium]
MKANVGKALWTSFILVALLVICGCPDKTVTITTDPNGAKLLINGEESGISPLTKQLSFANIKVFKVVAREPNDYRDGETLVEYEPVNKKNYHISLERVAKTVRITTEPSGAKIYIDGRESGISPLTIKLSFADTRQHDVVAKLERYEDGNTIIRLEPLEKKDYPIPPLKKIEIVSVELVSVVSQPTEKGVKLAVVRIPTLAYLEVIERSPMVKSVTRVTNNEDRNLKILDPVLSPRSDILVYGEFMEESDRTSYSNIWKTTVGSFGKTRVTYGKWRDLFPTFTPDGECLIFSSNRTRANPTLWRIKVDGGGGITNITNTLAEDYSPSVSPDSNFVAYASNPPDAEEPQIWTINSNGTLPTQLREGQSPRISPPDGGKIMFVRIDKLSKKKQIWVMNPNGSEETQLTQNSEYDAENPAWSPDGKWIVFDADEGLDSQKRQNYDVWLMAADGSKKTQLTTNGSWDDSPCWDHTGRFIYFRSNRGGAWNIWRFEPILP